jgi:hypothetical protein
MTSPVTGVFRGAWTTATAYLPGDVVTYLGVEYATSTAHTSTGSFDSTKFTTPAYAGDLSASGNVTLDTLGKSLRVKEGSNACMGTAVMNGTTAVVVATTAVTASSRIFVTINTPGGTPGSPYVFTRTAGTSFSLKSQASDTSTVAWLIVEPA